MSRGQTDALDRLQTLLEELFQIEDAAELDFGIYRVMGQKREEVEGFIHERLPQVVAEALESGSLARSAEASKNLEEAAKRVRETFGEEVIDESGELKKYHDSKPGKEYLAAQAKAEVTEEPEELRATIFNHLYTFFSRYYDNGDFISRRRYSKRERYVVPYNGEEVHLHWANADQYYIKSGNHFLDYAFDADDVKVVFRLVSADTEQNDVKETDRRFVPKTAAEHDPETKTVTVPFEWRPLSAKEKSGYGTQKQQDNINAAAEADLLKRFEGNVEVSAALSKTEAGKSVSVLGRHLARYARKNSSDFFVHKDLRGFLTRELDFYIKNEVLDIDALLSANGAGADVLAARFETVRSMRGIAEAVISFLAQIEDFQKRVFEKKKFVVESHYCMTLDRVPDDLLPEVAANEAQYAEWEDLYAISEIENSLENGGDVHTAEWLRANEHLVLDTKHFTQKFEDDLISNIEDLDDSTDGLLINADNFQALGLIGGRYAGQVKCIYIDPPYNSKTSEIIYKNSYKHSSWLTMMENRLR